MTLVRGACLFTAGDAPAGVFLIVRGRIKLLRHSEEGREQVLHEEGPGSTLAEVPVFDGQGYVASAVAAEDSEVFFVPAAPLLSALDRCPGSARQVIHVLAARIRKLAGVVEDLSHRAVVQRVAAYLCREAAHARSDRFDLGVTRDELAAHAGTVREQASRALSQLKASGVIEVAGRRIVIRDAASLRRIAGLARSR